MADDTTNARTSKRVFLTGATGTIGRATLSELVERGHEVVALVRPGSASPLRDEGRARERAEVRFGEISDPESLRGDGLRGERFDAIVSCLASRKGGPRDARAIDHDAHMDLLAAAGELAIPQFVLLSAICVQRPRLAFQHAKLAFEAALAASGLTYSIVRPTAYFKSLSGQVERVRSGKPFLIFGDGRLTACKPISDRDLAGFIVDCLERQELWNRILPVGGPGPALTPREIGETLFAMTGREPRFSSVPPGLFRAAASLLGAAGHVVPSLADRAEFLRIAHYYATESMLLFDEATGRYDAAATPSHGTDTLYAYFEEVLKGDASVELGEHKMFAKASDAGQ